MTFYRSPIAEISCRGKGHNIMDSVGLSKCSYMLK